MLRRRSNSKLAWLLIALIVLTGCQPIQPYYLREDGDLSHYLDVATDIEYADVEEFVLEEAECARAPLSVSNPEFDSYWDLSLEECMSTALSNSKVIRTLGPVRQFGQIIGNTPERLTTAADNAFTIYDVALVETSQFGVEQALANFDAIFNSTATWDVSDRFLNNTGAPQFTQDRVNITNELTKTAATGGQWSVRNLSIYTRSQINETSVGRATPSDWFTALETEVRQPLLRGRGTQINRIPVVVARIRADIAIADFQNQVADLMTAVEFAYWDLVFSYQNLRSFERSRDSALGIWQRVHARFLAGDIGAESEAQTKEQYFAFRARMEQAQRDLFRNERNLRYLMGLAPSDGRLIRPQDDPTMAKVAFDWRAIQIEALEKNFSLRRHQWRIKQAELELIAARNLLLPQVDAVALYRWLGVGNNFNSSNGNANYPDPDSTAIADFLSGNHQEYRLGFQASVPIGFRREMAEVRNRQLELARQRARYEEMQNEVMHQLSDAIQNLEAQYPIMQTSYNQRIAAYQQVQAAIAGYEAGTVILETLLDALRRQANADLIYHQALVEYSQTIAIVHLRKGSLFDYNGVLLAEGPWPAKAYFDAQNLARQRDASYYLDYGYSRPRVISRPQPPAQANNGLASETTQGREGATGRESSADANGSLPDESALEPIPTPAEGEAGEMPLPALDGEDGVPPPETPFDLLPPDLEEPPPGDLPFDDLEAVELRGVAPAQLEFPAEY